MPKGVENLLSGSPTLNQSSRRVGARSENGDLFQKVLEGSRPRAQRSEAAEKPQTPEKAATEKKSARPKRTDPANRRRRAGDQQTTDVEQSDSAAVQSDASVEVPITPEPASAEVSDAEPADPKVAKEAEPEQNIASPDDAAAAAILASQQIDVQQPASAPTPQATEQDTADVADETAEAISASKPIVKPLAAKPATEEGAPTAKTEKPSALELPIEAAAESAETDDDHASGDQPQQDAGTTDSHDEIARQIATPAPSQNEPRPRKVAGLGANEPSPVAQHDDQTDVDSSQQAVAAASATVEAFSQLSGPQVDDSSSEDAPRRAPPVSSSTDTLNATIGSTAAPKATAPDAKPVAAPPPPVPPEVEFGATNHDRIVTSLRSQLLPTGGTMHMRLDPPELGVLQVTVRMQDGVMTASFETSSDQATKLLSHSLGQLKSVLESQGVTVEKLHVQQSPRDQQANSNSDDRQQQSQHDSQSSARQEQQRREMLRRMWSRLGIGNDPLDMVA